MMIAYLAVVHNSLRDIQRPAQQRTGQRRVRSDRDTVQPLLERAGHIRRQIAAVRPRIGDELMLLV
ncbi:hypothetical protein D3C76_1635090 [compost metagenome]